MRKSTSRGIHDLPRPRGPGGVLMAATGLKRVFFEIIREKPKDGIWWQPWSDVELYIIAKEVSSLSVLVEKRV